MRSTRDTFHFGPECVAPGFQILFIMREEGVKLIKTSGVRYQPSVAVPIDFRAITQSKHSSEITLSINIILYILIYQSCKIPNDR